MAVTADHVSGGQDRPRDGRRLARRGARAVRLRVPHRGVARRALRRAARDRPPPAERGRAVRLRRQALHAEELRRAAEAGPASVPDPRRRRAKRGTARPAVRFASEYNTTLPTPDEARERRARLDEFCAEAGRDPVDAAALDDDAAASSAATAPRSTSGCASSAGHPWKPEASLIGTVDEVAERLREYEDGGNHARDVPAPPPPRPGHGRDPGPRARSRGGVGSAHGLRVRLDRRARGRPRLPQRSARARRDGLRRQRHRLPARLRRLQPLPRRRRTSSTSSTAAARASRLATRCASSGPGGLLHVESTTPRRVSNASEDEELVLLVVGGSGGYVERDGEMVDPADIERRRAFSSRLSASISAASHRRRFGQRVLVRRFDHDLDERPVGRERRIRADAHLGVALGRPRPGAA